MLKHVRATTFERYQFINSHEPGWQKGENVGLGQKMPFMDEH